MKNAKTKKPMPNTLFVYHCDYDNDGEPILAAEDSIDEISDDFTGSKVGVYVLHHTGILKVRRELSGV